MFNRSLLAALAIATCLAALQARGQVINTIAGGRSDNGLTAAHVGLGRANGVAIDSAGNLYVSDSVCATVRRIDALSGISRVVAGNGTHGFSGDGGRATDAQLAIPVGVAVDSAGNLYIADAPNSRIWRVDAATQVIRTFAGGGQTLGDGGPATNAVLASPEGVALDSAGNVYIAEFTSNRVRKVDASSKIITTVAGNGTFGYTGDGGPATAAELRNPFAVTIDPSGNLFIADTNNSVVRKVSAATGIITTVAGNNKQGSTGDGGPATAATFRFPEGVAVDAAGNVWIADPFSNRIRKVDAATNIINTVAGDGTGALSGDGGPASAGEFNFPRSIALDAAGNAYIADFYNQRVRKIDAATKNISTVVGLDVVDQGDPLAVQLAAPQGVAVGSSGNVYIADSGNRRIRKIDAMTKTITTFAGGDFSSASPFLIPIQIAVDSAENIYVLDAQFDKVLKVDAVTRQVSPIAGTGSFGFTGDSGPATSATVSLSFSSSVALDAAGNVLIADTFNNRVRRVDHTTGIITTIAGNGTTTDSGDGLLATSAGVVGPQGLAVDRSGNIYISESANVIRRVDASGAISTLVSSGLKFPSALAIDLDGNLLISDSGSNTIKKLNLTTKALSTIAGDGVTRFAGDSGLATSASLDFPNGIAVSSSGAIYIADTNSERLRVITTLPPRRRTVRR